MRKDGWREWYPGRLETLNLDYNTETTTRQTLRDVQACPEYLGVHTLGRRKATVYLSDLPEVDTYNKKDHPGSIWTCLVLTASASSSDSVDLLKEMLQFAPLEREKERGRVFGEMDGAPDGRA